MINKIYKIIHRKYSRFFEFIFFLRYLLLIFLISISLFLITPVFFNYEKKAEAIKLHLLNDYNFEIRSYEEIKYNKKCIIPSEKLLDMELTSKSKEIICPSQCDFKDCLYKCNDEILNSKYYDPSRNLYKNIKKDKNRTR